MKLSIQNLKKKFSKVQALNGVSLELDPGVYGVLGPNGAGKSTMIKIITGNLKATDGTVMYDDVEIHKEEKKYKCKLGYVPQRQGMYETFTAQKFLEYMAVLKCIPRQEIPQQVEHVLRIVDLWEVRQRKLGGFSGGMSQRILIAQALLGNPEIIILDEPTAGLDPKERIRIRNFISRISEEKIILVATHVVADVESIAKEIILLGNGKIQKRGTPKELCESINGCVFEAEIDAHTDLEELDRKFVLSNIKEMLDGSIKVRFIRDIDMVQAELAGYHINKVFPNLQEVYLSIFDRKKVGA